MRPRNKLCNAVTASMKVHLSFDVEIWCDGWTRLDEVFPERFERYVYGRSQHGEFALPQTLKILKRHGLQAVFFVESLFSARFGAHYLRAIVDLIRADDHEVQLHIHPEWIDEIEPPVIASNGAKRQHLCYYDLEEQTAIIRFGKRLLEEAGSGEITAFRAGSYAVNRNSFVALARNHIGVDSSLNRCFPISGADLRDECSLLTSITMSGVRSVPVTVFRDGMGRHRPAQVGACSFAELRDALISASAAATDQFVIVSHNFEMLKPDSRQPDMIVARRFERLCAYLASNKSDFDVCGYGKRFPLGEIHVPDVKHQGDSLVSVRFSSTLVRVLEQLRRRLAQAFRSV